MAYEFPKKQSPVSSKQPSRRPFSGEPSSWSQHTWPSREFPYTWAAEMACDFGGLGEGTPNVHVGWDPQDAGKRDQVFADGDTDRLVEELQTRRAHRTARLAARTKDRKQRKNWRSKEIAAEVFSLGLYRSTFDAERAQRKLGETLAREAGEQVEALHGAAARVESPTGKLTRELKDKRRAEMIERLSAELIAATQDMASPLDADAARATAASIIDSYLANVSEGDGNVMTLLAEQQAEKWQGLAKNNLKPAQQSVIAALVRSELEGNNHIPSPIINSVVGAMALVTGASPTLVSMALVGLSKSTPAELEVLGELADDLATRDLHKHLGRVIISEGYALADLEGTDRKAALERIALAGEQLMAVHEKHGQLASEEAEQLSRTGALGLEEPMTVEIAGISVSVYVHPGVTSNELGEWLVLLEEAVKTFPHGIREELIGSAGEGGTKPFHGFALYPGSSINYMKLNTDDVEGHYQPDASTVAMGVNVRESRADALFAMRHELVHRLDDILAVDRVGTNFPSWGSQNPNRYDSWGNLEPSALDRHHHERADRFDPEQGAEMAEMNERAKAVGIISHYALAGDEGGEFIPREYVAESMAAYLDPGGGSTRLAKLDPVLYRTLGHVLWLADQGRLDDAREALVNLTQPASDAEMYLPPR